MDVEIPQNKVLIMAEFPRENGIPTQFTLAQFFWAITVVATMLAVVAADRKWGPRHKAEPTRVYSGMHLPYSYDLATGHRDTIYPNCCYLGTVLFEPKSWAQQKVDRRMADWQKFETSNVPCNATMSWGGEAATMRLPFSYNYVRWEGAAGAQMLHLYLRDPRTIDFSACAESPYDRVSGGIQVLEAYEKGGWTVLCVAGDIRSGCEFLVDDDTTSP